MKRKARIQTGIDDRLVAIYARKSRITNKGDSIGVQFKQSADYAINQLSLPEDYEFARYEDKGLSGYYSDRPDFQRLLRDIEMGKIKAVACYKLDRISRKTSDLMRLLEYFERHDVTLLVCSNNINTRISTSKIIIQVLAIIAEFERDILTERIQDNLMELAKDGRWLGGKTPTGFSSQRVTTGSGKNKSAISFLVPVQEEKEIVLEIYGTFWETRSLLQTANIINEKYETKHGAKFTTSTIRLILRNPIYCVADEYSYNYFLEHDGNLFGEPSDFDGQHGLTAYNKTDQMKVEDEDSTFFNPKFSQLLTRKPISEWIVSVGRHEGFISSRKWVETQNMLDEIAEKYNRPHRKTNALLSGLMYCPICGKRLRVLPESNRWTNGKPRFKYACPGVRAKECTFKGVEGVTLDEFVIHSLSSLQEEHSDYYRQLLENRVASMIRTDQSEKEYQETKKAIERLNADIAAQVRNLREADDALKRFIQDDIKELTDELAKREAALRRMEDTQSENQYLIHELNGMKKRLLSFEEFAKGAQPEALFTLVHSIVDRIYITTDGTKQKCQVYIKGCATEDYSDVLGAAGYIEEEPLLPVASYVPPMCDLDYYSIINELFAYTDQMFEDGEKGSSEEKMTTGIFFGEGSIVYGYQLLYQITKNVTFLKYGAKHCEILRRCLKEDEQFDIVGGNAGAVMVFLNMYDLQREDCYLEMAERAAGVLLKKAVAGETGIGWKNISNGTLLGGFAHGCAGIMYALSRLSAYTGKKEYLEAAYQAFLYERTLYCPEKGGWRDLRSEEELYMSDFKWCHGTAGILFGWKLSLPYFEGIQKETVSREIKRLMEDYPQVLIKEEVGLCHGNLGNAMIGHCVESDSWKASSQENVLKSVEILHEIFISKEGKAGLHEQYDYSLMTGLAGAGYGLLYCLHQDLPGILDLRL